MDTTSWWCTRCARTLVYTRERQEPIVRDTVTVSPQPKVPACDQYPWGEESDGKRVVTHDQCDGGMVDC